MLEILYSILNFQGICKSRLLIKKNIRIGTKFCNDQIWYKTILENKNFDIFLRNFIIVKGGVGFSSGLESPEPVNFVTTKKC